MISRFLKLFALAVFIGPVIAAFLMAPVEPLAAWRVWGLTLVPAAFVLVTGTVFLAYRPLVDAPLPDSAGVWLRKTLARMNVFGVTVAAVEHDERGHGNYFHPASKTIVLDEDVYGEHTARAYATAAHELGHALFHNDHPWLSHILLAARRHAARCFFHGVALLFGTVIAGDASLRVFAFALVALSVVLHALVVVDEAIASSMAGELLRRDLGDADQGGIARGHLQRALATYLSVLIAYLVPLAAAPWILDGSAGLLTPGAPLDGAAAVFADIGAWIVVAGAAAAVVFVMSPWRTFPVVMSGLVVILGLVWAPFLATSLADQAAVPRWTVALATVAAWPVMVMPLLVVVRRFAGTLMSVADVMPMPLSSSVYRVSRKKLRDKEPEDGILARASIYSFVLWIVPLAVAWLF